MTLTLLGIKISGIAQICGQHMSASCSSFESHKFVPSVVKLQLPTGGTQLPARVARGEGALTAAVRDKMACSNSLIVIIVIISAS